MGPADLSQPQSWRGKFWLPATPEEPATGILSYRPDSGLELVLVGGFGPAQWDSFHDAGSEPAWDSTIHGEAGGDDITLFGCIATNSLARGMDFFTGGVTEQTFLAHEAIVGAHLDSRDEGVLLGVEFAMQGLAQWAPPDGLELRVKLDYRYRPIGAEATHAATPDTKAQVSDGEVSLRRSWRMPRRAITRKGAAINLAVHPSLRWVPREGRVSLEEALARVQKLSACVAFANAASLPLIWVRFPTRIGNEYIDYYAHYASVTTEVDVPADPLFTSEVLGFSQTLEAWDAVWDRFQHPLNIVLNAWSTGRSTVEANAILTVIAAEVFHQALEEPPPMSTDERNRLVKSLQNAVEPGRREWVSNIVPRGHSLKQRLDRLAARLEGPVGRAILPAPQKWSRSARQVRNDIGHGGHTSEPFEVLVAVADVTRAVIIINLLAEMDFSEEHVLDLLRRNPRLARACDESRRHFQ